MREHNFRVFGLVIGSALLMTMGSQFVSARKPAIQELLDQVGLMPHGTQRGQMDVVGFASTAEQMDQVLDQCGQFAEPRLKALNELYGWDDSTALITAICPHDDYYYAGRLYQLLIPQIRAKRVILFGVFHKARVFNIEDKLVFDAFKTWHGPYGPVAVSSLREEIQNRLPGTDFTVDNDAQMVEHSVEAIVPFLQAYNPDVEIVSILAPYMNWDTMDKLAADLSNVMNEIFSEKGWRLGEDVALICSADAVHYGNVGWGGSTEDDMTLVLARVK